MSSASTGFTEEQQRRAPQVPLGVDYIPTEEERKLLRECNHEGFLYRSLPFSVISVAITQVLISRGALTASPRFGSLPKVAFAGFCGYIAGKLSYMKTCQEKFKKLENSPLGEILRQRSGSPPHYAAQSELSDSNSQSFDSMFQPTETPSSTRDYGYGYSPDTPMGGATDSNPPAAQAYDEDEEPKKKAIFYEDLRLKNRENYEVTLIQKADTMLKAAPQDAERPKKEAKKNKYGDSWEE